MCGTIDLDMLSFDIDSMHSTHFHLSWYIDTRWDLILMMPREDRGRCPRSILGSRECLMPEVFIGIMRVVHGLYGSPMGHDYQSVEIFRQEHVYGDYIGDSISLHCIWIHYYIHLLMWFGLNIFVLELLFLDYVVFVLECEHVYSALSSFIYMLANCCQPMIPTSI